MLLSKFSSQTTDLGPRLMIFALRLSWCKTPESVLPGKNDDDEGPGVGALIKCPQEVHEAQLEAMMQG